MNKKLVYIIVLLVTFGITACATSIPKTVLSNVDKVITFKMLITDPASYRNKIVMLGGEIVSSKNETNNTTSLEVIDFPLKSDYKPRMGDHSDGRFIAVNNGYLETEIYKPGRLVTIVGSVTGTKEGKIGDMKYNFPVINITYIKLWHIHHKEYLYQYPYPMFYFGPNFYPPWWYYPYGITFPY